ncbi:MAG: hypothetical protein LBN37_06595, partial [Bacteroidales bacterium]|nr:hypothetical protein [Bacteroidales bacterium]
MTIQELLINRGLDGTKSIKLVRHADKRKVSVLYDEYLTDVKNVKKIPLNGIVNMYELYKKDKNWFLWYQRGQRRDKPPFHD